MKYILTFDYANGETEQVSCPFNSDKEAWSEKENVINHLCANGRELPVSWCVVEIQSCV